MKLDPIAVVEACYRPADGEVAWLRGVLEALQGLDLGGAHTARLKDTGPHGRFRPLAAAQRGTLPQDWLARLDAAQAQAPEAALAAFYWPFPPVRRARAAARQLGPEAEALLASALAQLGLDDAYGVLAGGPEGRLLDVGLGIRGRGRLAPSTRHQLALVSAHLTSALRLRVGLGGPAPSPDDEATEAVLDPGGAVRHAAGPAQARPARERLVEAVRRVERARGSLRRTSPAEAAELWRGLVDGRWSLVDHHEASGRRSILVRRNEPRLPDPRGLTPRERDVLAYAALGHSSKYVAYLLGLAPSTVAGHVAMACRKLGVRDRQDALAMLWPGLRPAPTSPPAQRGRAVGDPP